MSKKVPKKVRASMAENKLRSEGAEFLVLANLLIHVSRFLNVSV